MNHLFIIGNGFDLAHGMKTSYADFMKNLKIKQINANAQGLNDKYGYLKVKNPGGYGIPDFEDDEELRRICGINNISVTPYGELIRGIFDDIRDKKWVDIERYFFNVLKRQYIQNTTTHSLVNSPEKGIEPLNRQLKYLKEELVHYLNHIEKAKDPIPEILHHFISTKEDSRTKKMIVNFNYTNTINLYDVPNSEVINIHGSLDDTLDKIIFGYGDEMEPVYLEMETLNENCYLENFKSFYYLKNNLYRKLNTFIRSNDKYYVHIMGHSCGISDRILLNSIFENKSCAEIIIYYHDKGKSNDYFEKSMNISRHFSASAKQDFRIKVAPEKDSKPLVTFEN